MSQSLLQKKIGPRTLSCKSNVSKQILLTQYTYQIFDSSSLFFFALNQHKNTMKQQITIARNAKNTESVVAMMIEFLDKEFDVATK